MPIIKINGLAYELDTLGEESKGHLRYLAFVDSELERLMMRADMLTRLGVGSIGHCCERPLPGFRLTPRSSPRRPPSRDTLHHNPANAGADRTCGLAPPPA